MDIGSLSAFVAAYDSGSMTKAAQRLYMSPQGLSKSISKLEGEVGARLFERSRQGVVPTKYARAVYPKAKDLIDVLNRVREEAGSSAPYHALKVAVSNGMVSYLGLDFVTSFEAVNPGIELQLEECSNSMVEQLILLGEAEVGFLVAPVDEMRFSCSFFQSVPHVLFVSDQSPLACKPAISWRDLAGLTVMHLGCDYPVGRNLKERLASAGVTPAATIGVAGADTALPYVIRNEAVLVSADFWARLSQRAGLRIVPFEDATFAWNVFVAQKRGIETSEAAQAFISAVFEWRDEMGR